MFKLDLEDLGFEPCLPRLSWLDCPGRRRVRWRRGVEERGWDEPAASVCAVAVEGEAVEDGVCEERLAAVALCRGGCEGDAVGAVGESSGEYLHHVRGAVEQRCRQGIPPSCSDWAARYRGLAKVSRSRL